jgi:hypothetical protein
MYGRVPACVYSSKKTYAYTLRVTYFTIVVLLCSFYAENYLYRGFVMFTPFRLIYILYEQKQTSNH